MEDKKMIEMAAEAIMSKRVRPIKQCSWKVWPRLESRGGGSIKAPRRPFGLRTGEYDLPP